MTKYRFIDRSKEYFSTVGEGHFHTTFRLGLILLDTVATVTVNLRERINSYTLFKLTLICV